MALVFRFMQRTRRKVRNAGPPSPEELQAAEIWIFKHVQKSAFQDDLAKIEKKVPCSDRLQKLVPFVDEKGLIRVGGRLQHSNLEFESRHPIILPPDHHITKILIRHEHLQNLHAGPQALQSILYQKFWILAGRRAIRECTHTLFSRQAV